MLCVLCAAGCGGRTIVRDSIVPKGRSSSGSGYSPVFTSCVRVPRLTQFNYPSKQSSPPICVGKIMKCSELKNAPNSRTDHVTHARQHSSAPARLPATHTQVEMRSIRETGRVDPRAPASRRPGPRRVDARRPRAHPCEHQESGMGRSNPRPHRLGLLVVALCLGTVAPSA